MEDKDNNFSLLERRFKDLKEKDEQKDKEVFERIIRQWCLEFE